MPDEQKDLEIGKPADDTFADEVTTRASWVEIFANEIPTIIQRQGEIEAEVRDQFISWLSCRVDLDLVEDVAQDVELHLCVVREKLDAAWRDSQANYSAYGNRDASESYRRQLFVIRSRAAYTSMKRRKARIQNEVQADLEYTQNVLAERVEAEDVLRELAQTDDATQLRQAVEALPEPFREAVASFYLNGEPTNETARRCGVSTEAIRTRRSRGIATLRERLDPALLIAI